MKAVVFVDRMFMTIEADAIITASSFGQASKTLRQLRGDGC